MKIKPYFKSQLTKPFQGKHLHQTGTEVIMNMSVKTKTIGDFMVMLPDPVSLNLNNAQNAIDKCEKLKERINTAKKFNVFSEILNEVHIRGLTPEKIKELDSEANIFRELDQDKVFEYLQTSMGVIVSLVTSIESFVNVMIPNDYKHERTTRKGEKEFLEKDLIVIKLSIEEKLEILSLVKSKPDLKAQSFWESFIKIKELRNDIIHFKKMTEKIDEMWNPILVFLFDSKLQDLFDNSVRLIQYLVPDYLDIEE